MLSKEFVSVDVETIRRAIDVSEIAIKNTSYCISEFKQQNSWKLKEKFVLQTLERELAKSKAINNELRSVLGWPLFWGDKD